MCSVESYIDHLLTLCYVSQWDNASSRGTALVGAADQRQGGTAPLCVATDPRRCFSQFVLLQSQPCLPFSCLVQHNLEGGPGY